MLTVFQKLNIKVTSSATLIEKSVRTVYSAWTNNSSLFFSPTACFDLMRSPWSLDVEDMEQEDALTPGHTRS